jgi:archaellin
MVGKLQSIVVMVVMVVVAAVAAAVQQAEAKALPSHASHD